MCKPRFGKWMFLGGLMVLGTGVVCGQDYPNKPIRMITRASGGANDFLARLTAQGLSSSLGQQVIVDNRPDFNAQAQIVTKAPPDGYTLLYGGGAFWIYPLLRTVPYDPVRELSPISLMTRSFNVLVVHPSLPVNSVKELIALAKANPGALNYASGGTGGPGHLTGELFKSMAHINMAHIPYKGGAAALSDLITGQVQITFDNPATVMPLVKAGRLRALAITNAEPSALVPGLPTVAASLPGFSSLQMSGILAPAKTPGAIISRLNEEIGRFVNRPDVKEQYFSRGIEVVYSTPDEFAAAIKSEIARLGKVIKDANIKAD